MNEVPGLLLLRDFEKAFDSVLWDFIHLTLEAFNFPKGIQKWVKMFQDRSNSQVSQNGCILNSFPMGRGCRQGDPISPYIFIICAELLSQTIKNCRDIRGLEID